MTTVYISSGVTSSGLVLTTGEYLDVLRGGTVIDTTINSGGGALVAGGTASGTVVNAGFEYVFVGGTSFGTVVNGGIEYVDFEGTAIGTVLSNGSYEYVSSGGTAIDNTVSGSTVLMSGGMEIGLTIISGGSSGVVVEAGGVLSGGTIFEGTDANISSGGTASGVTADNAGLEVYDSGVASASIIISSGHFDIFSGGTSVSATLSNSGAAFVSSGGTASGTVISSGGTQTVAGGTASGTMVSSGGGEIVGDGTASGTMVSTSGYQFLYSSGVANGTMVSSGGYQIVYSGGTASGTMVSSGGTEIVFADGVASGIILNNGGTLDETAFTYAAGATLSFDSATDMLTITEGSHNYTVSFAGDYTSETFAAASDGDGGTLITVQPACFFAGTRLATAQGEIAVEEIMPGTMLKTAAGALLPVRWLGRSEVSTRFGHKLRVLPIRIKAGALGEAALGEALPQRDLLLSPDHALFICGVLVQAGALVNGSTILRETNVPETFTYYHVELATHELLLAEGAAAESFVDNADRMNFSNWAEHEALGGVAPITELPYPRAKAHRQVPMPVRELLDARAALTNLPPPKLAVA